MISKPERWSACEPEGGRRTPGGGERVHRRSLVSPVPRLPRGPRRRIRWPCPAALYSMSLFPIHTQGASPFMSFRVATCRRGTSFAVFAFVLRMSGLEWLGQHGRRRMHCLSGGLARLEPFLGDVLICVGLRC